MLDRKKTHQINIGSVPIGGNSPISVQSMTTIKTEKTDDVIAQINRLADTGCDIVRLAIRDLNDAEAIGELKNKVATPLVADIHFDYRLALAVLKNGIDALRLNPGNIKEKDHVATVVKEAKKRNVPIRIGVNAGSLDENMVLKYSADGKITAEAMVESALSHIKILEELDFNDIKISLKAHEVPLTIKAYRLMSEMKNYPLHLGITEAGTLKSGLIKSAVGIGSLLSQGIGDTIRVSLTTDPVEEVKAANQILKSLNLKTYGPTLISCPTCGRCRINLFEIATKVEERLEFIKEPINVAVMGCEVNGPGEAKEADVGIAGGLGQGLLFRKGQIIRKVPENELLDALFFEIEKILEEKNI